MDAHGALEASGTKEKQEKTLAQQSQSVPPTVHTVSHTALCPSDCEVGPVAAMSLTQIKHKQRGPHRYGGPH